MRTAFFSRRRTLYSLTAATLALAAAILGALQLQIVAQDVEQRGVGFSVHGLRRAVDDQRDGFRHDFLQFPE